jgi:hypothetical protein
VQSKKLEISHLHISKEKCKGKIVVWKPKEHQQNITRKHQGGSMEHNKEALTSTKRTQQKGVDE